MLLAQASNEPAAVAIGTGVGLMLVVVAAILRALIGALFVQLATRVACRFTPPYGMAFKAAVVVALAMLAVNLATHYLGLQGLPGGVLSTVAGFLVGGAIFGRLLRGPDGPIGFGKGVLVSLVLAVVGLLIGLVLGVIAGLFVAGS